MATQTRSPTSDQSASGTWTGTAGTRYTLVDDHPDSAGSDSLTHGTTAGAIQFGFSAFTLQGNASISSLAVNYYDAKTGGAAAQMGGRITVNGTAYSASTHNPANGSWTLRQDSWATNPDTSSAWTAADLAGTGSNPLQYFGVYSGDANPTVQLASIQLEVTYTLPTGVGIAATSALGTPGHTVGAVSFTGVGIAGTSATGTPTTLSVYTSSITSIGPDSAIGTPTTIQEVGDGGFESTAFETTGFDTPVGAQTSTLVGIAATSAIGTADHSSAVTEALTGLSSTAAMGTPGHTLGAATSDPTGIAGASAVGTPDTTIYSGTYVPGISSGAGVGTPAAVYNQTSVGTGKASTAAIGTPTTVAGGTARRVRPGMSSTAAFGSPGYTSTATRTVVGIGSEYAVGHPDHTTIRRSTITGVASGEASGTPVMIPGAVSHTVVGLESTAAVVTAGRLRRRRTFSKRVKAHFWAA